MNHVHLGLDLHVRTVPIQVGRAAFCWIKAEIHDSTLPDQAVAYFPHFGLGLVAEDSDTYSTSINCNLYSGL